MASASSRTASSSWAAGTTRLTRPSSRARRAEIGLPVSSISRAAFGAAAHLAQVVPRTEDRAARAEHDDTGRAIRSDQGQRLLQVRQQIAGQGVALLGSIEGQVDDAVPGLEVETSGVQSGGFHEDV